MRPIAKKLLVLNQLSGGVGCVPYSKIDGTVSVSSTFVHPADGVLAWTQTTLPASNIQMRFRILDANNYLRVQIDSNRTLNLYEVVASSLLLHDAVPLAVSAGDRIAVAMNGPVIEIYVNGVQIISAAGITNFATRTDGLYFFAGSGVVTNLKTWELDCRSAESAHAYAEGGTAYYIEFNGSNTAIGLRSLPALDNLHDGAFTAEAWVRPDNLSLGRIFDKGGWLLYVNEGLQAIIDCATTDAQMSSGLDEFPPDSVNGIIPVWTHVCLEWDDATDTKLQIYINGQLPASFTTDIARNGAIVSDAANNLVVGNRNAGDRPYDGGIGWQRISSGKRYGAEFVPPSRVSPPVADATTLYLARLTEGSGTVVHDNSKHTLGTLSNGSWQAAFGDGVTGSDLTTAAGASLFAFSASRLPHQRSNFYAAGRYWQFYGNYSTAQGPIGLYAVSSTDGLHWTVPVFVANFPQVDAQWSVAYDEVTGYVHLGYNIQSLGTIPHDGLRYWRGQPLADGAIVWHGLPQIVVATGHSAGDFSLEIDSDGYPWFAYSYGLGEEGLAVAVVQRNNLLTNKWTAASGFPADIQAGVVDFAFAIVAPLDDGSMYVAYYEWNVDAQAHGYIVAADGTVTDDGACTVSAVEGDSGSTAQVARLEIASLRDGTIHLVYQDSSQNIKYRKRSSGSWGSEVTLSNSSRVTEAISSPRLSFGDSGEIYVTWSQAAALWLCAYNGAAWNTPVQVKSDSYESSYEHAMPARLANGNKLQVATLLADYTLRVYLLDV